MTYKLVWVEIDLDIIAANFYRIKKLLQGSTKLLAVVKADAYGHGALPVARTLAAAGADYLAVATADEALALREGGIEISILVLNTGLPDGQEEVLVRYGVTQTVSTLELAAAIDRAACKLHKKGLAHLKVETGMGRLGIGVEEVPAFLRAVGPYRGLYLEGILNYPQFHLDMVRAGCIIYGFYPRGDEKERKLLKLVPALTWKTVVVHAGPVTDGQRLAVLPVGRSHGLPPSAREVLVGGRRVRVCKVALDHCVVAVPQDVGITPGVEVVLLGKQGEEEIPAEEVAGWAGTITEEITCRLGNLPHIYKGGAKGPVIKDGDR